MRVAYLMNQYPSDRQPFVGREIAALERAGAKVSRFAFRRPLERTHDARRERKRTRYLSECGVVCIMLAALAGLRHPRTFIRGLREAIRLSNTSGGVGPHLAYFAHACRLTKWLREADITHIHVHGSTRPAAVARIVQAMTGTTYSLAIPPAETIDAARGLDLALKIRSAEFVCATSHHARAHVLRWSDCADWGKVHVVRLGLDLEMFGLTARRVRPTGKLVSIGRFTASQGQLVLIDAVGKLLERGLDPQLVLVGDGPMRRDLQNRIDELGLARYVQLLGPLPAGQARMLLADSAAFVLPSLVETAPHTLLEAMANGRPIVASGIGSVLELIEPGLNGWLVPPGDVNALADTLEAVLTSTPELLTMLGTRAADSVCEAHDVSIETAKLRRLLAGCLPEAQFESSSQLASDELSEMLSTLD